MTTPNRKQVLTANQAIRQGQLPAPRRLDEGYVALRIPEQDYKVLTHVYPELVSKDHAVRLAAWKKLEASALGDQYRVTQRSPSQVRRSSNHGIIVR